MINNKYYSFCWLLVLLLIFNSQAKEKPLKVFILAGQSNMQGTGHVKTLPHMAKDPKTKALHDKILGEDGKFLTYKDVQISAISAKSVEKQGALTVGFGSGLTKPDVCGPELAFGITMYEKLGEPILLIKTSWGGKSLAVDFRPPSAGVASYGKNEEQKEKSRKASGFYYQAMIEHVKKVLDDPGKYHPAFNKSAGYELAGFAWFQGWNDMVNGGVYPNRYKPGGYDEYSELLAHFIRDVRKELQAPKMPFAIGVMGVGGPTKDYDSPRYKGVHQYFRDAMAAPASMPEFKGNVSAVLTENFWPKDIDAVEKKKKAKKQLTDEEKKLLEIGKSNAGFHYLGNLKCYSQIGQALALAINEMKK
ncbi:MAG: sialate O-acetylesterase [Lentisphaeraceae bacterium]|nr:sialate O-acetylesterase [Lentisphaeraceae bacterium]